MEKKPTTLFVRLLVAVCFVFSLLLLVKLYFSRQQPQDEITDFAVAQQGTEQEECLVHKSMVTRASQLMTPQRDGWYDERDLGETLDSIKDHPECFTLEEANVYTVMLHRHMGMSLLEAVSRRGCWQDYRSDIESWRYFAPTVRTFSGDIVLSTLATQTTGSATEMTDLSAKMEIHTKSCSNTIMDFNEAYQTACGLASKDDVNTYTQLVLRRYYERYYKGEIRESQDEIKRLGILPAATAITNLDDFTTGFVRGNRVLPMLMVRDLGLTQDQIQAIFTKWLDSTWSSQGEEQVQAWIDEGHDPDMLWRVVCDSLVSGGWHQAAIQIAVKHLGQRKVHEIEQARIAYLLDQGRYSVTIDYVGRQSYSFPMYDEQVR